MVYIYHSDPQPGASGRSTPPPEAFAVNEVGPSEWSQWSEEMETLPWSTGSLVRGAAQSSRLGGVELSRAEPFWILAW